MFCELLSLQAFFYSNSRQTCSNLIVFTFLVTLRLQKQFPKIKTDKIFETNSSFHVK